MPARVAASRRGLTIGVDTPDRSMPTIRLPWTIRLCQRSHRGSSATGARSGSGCSSSTSSGARPTSRSPSRSRRSRRSSWRPPGSCWPACPAHLVGRARRPAFASPSRRELRDSADRRWPPPRRRDGPRRLRRADRPVGHRGAAHRDDAGLGRRPRRRLPRRAAAAPGRARGRRRLRRRRDPRRPSTSVATGALEPVGLIASWPRRSSGRPARCSRPTGPCCPASRSSRPAPDGPRRRSSSRSWPSSPASSRPSMPRP